MNYPFNSYCEINLRQLLRVFSNICAEEGPIACNFLTDSMQICEKSVVTQRQATETTVMMSLLEIFTIVHEPTHTTALNAC